MDLAELEQIIGRVESDLRQCAFALETLRPIVFDDPAEVLQRFKNNYSAHVVNFLQRSLAQDAISTISRMWDQGREVRSIPRVMRELQDETVVAEIKAKRRDAMLGILKPAELSRLVRAPGDEELITRHAHADADRAARRVDDEIAEVRSMCEATDLRNLLESNANWRDKHVAHSLEVTRREQNASRTGVQIAGLEWGDLYEIKAMTNPVVARLMILVASVSIFTEDSEKIFAKYSGSFWRSFVDEPL